MKSTIAIGAVGACLCISLSSAFGQADAKADSQGPDRILTLLDEKERAYLNDETKTEGLTAEDMEHAKRIKRLHQLEMEKDVITEPAGAEAASRQILISQTTQPQPPVDEGIEQLEMQQQENSNLIMRDMARLRAEVLRLNARVQALELELDGTLEPLEEEAQPRFYLPIR